MPYIRKQVLLFMGMVAGLLAYSQSGHLVISQVYAGGGNAGAPFKNDFVEIYNPTQSAVSFSNWSIQYTSAGSSGTWSDKVAISGTIPAGGYFLVQLQGGATGADLPTPDAFDYSINLAVGGGKIALVSHTTTLSGVCPKQGVVDMIGYGTSNCSEGLSAAAGSNSLAILRRDGGCRDTDDNQADFYIGAPNPRNSLAPANICSGVDVIATGTVDAPFCIDDSNVATGTVTFSAWGSYHTTFTAYLSDASGNFSASIPVGAASVSGTDPSSVIPVTIPAGTATGNGYKIRVEASGYAVNLSPSINFEIINGVPDVTALHSSFTENTILLNWTNPSNCFDEVMVVVRHGNTISAMPSGNGAAYNPDLNFTGAGTEFGGGKVVYKGTVSGQYISGLSSGSTYFIKLFVRRGTAWSTGVEINVMPRLLPTPGEILINQFSPGYNGASDEYIELVNTTNKIFNLADVAIRYQSASGSSGLAGGVLSGTLLAKQYWLLSSNATITVGMNHGTPRDGAIAAGMAATSGQLALVRVTDNTILDALGYGAITGGTYVEFLPAESPPVNGGLRRKVDGLDTDNNSNDFITVSNGDIRLRTSGNYILPVHFLQTTIGIVDKRLKLTYSTSTSAIIKFFEIERSDDGMHYKTVAQQHSSGLDKTCTYTYHEVISHANAYYRVKAILQDGRFIYSPVIRTTSHDADSPLTYIHNYAGTGICEFAGKLEKGTFQLSIKNILGQPIFTGVFNHDGGRFKKQIFLKGVQPGWYLAEVRSNEKLFSKGFIIR